jgi:hypothetical protein
MWGTARSFKELRESEPVLPVNKAEGFLG